jgi:hypothetical protein
MKLRFLSFLILMLLLGACRQRDVMNGMPSNVLPRHKMIPLLVDIHLTEAALKLNPSTAKPNDNKLYYSSAYSPVFIKHGTNPDQFNRSMQWYTRHINLLEEIYTEVITNLNTLEALNRPAKTLKNKEGQVPIKKDSGVLMKIKAGNLKIKKSGNPKPVK